MQFGESLARLTAEMVAGHGARRAAAVARGATVSALRDEVRQTVAASAAKRAAMAAALAHESATLRGDLAAHDAALKEAVGRNRQATRHSLATMRSSLEQQASALHDSLDASRRERVAGTTAFRAATRAARAASSTALRTELTGFMSRLRKDAAERHVGVQAQLAIARGMGGKKSVAKAEAGTRPAVAKAAASFVPAAELPVVTGSQATGGEATASAGVTATVTRMTDAATENRGVQDGRSRKRAADKEVVAGRDERSRAAKSFGAEG